MKKQISTLAGFYGLYGRPNCQQPETESRDRQEAKFGRLEQFDKGGTERTFT